VRQFLVLWGGKFSS